MPVPKNGKRPEPALLPVAALAVVVLLGFLSGPGGEKTFRTIPVAHPPRFWIEVDRPGEPPLVRFFPASPPLSELAPQAVSAEDTFLANGDRVRLVSGDPAGYRLDRMPGRHLLLFDRKIDINKAGRRDLKAVPGIGPRLAERIVTHRENRGDFRSLDDLKKVGGIGEKSLSKFREYLTIYPDE